MPTDASEKKLKKSNQMFFDDGAVKDFGLGKEYMDGSVLLTDDIYGGTITEVSKEKLLKYKVTDFDEEKKKFTLAY